MTYYLERGSTGFFINKSINKIFQPNTGSKFNHET